MTSAIKPRITMVLVSIHPFALRRIFLVAAALLFFSAFCFADSVFMAANLPAAQAGLGRTTGWTEPARARLNLKCLFPQRSLSVKLPGYLNVLTRSHWRAC